MSTVDKLNKVLETKQAIKEAIESKGQTVGDVFADYPAAIQNIEGGGGSGTFVVPGGMRFAYSKTLEKFPENWDWSEFEKETDLSYLFATCPYLREAPKLKISPTTTSKMFYGCTNITDIDTSNWDSSRLTNMSETFSSCQNLESIDLSNISTGKCTDLNTIFSSCNVLKSINWDFDTSKNTNFKSMFANCKLLDNIPEMNASANTNSITSTNSPIYNCCSLRNFGGFKGFNKTLYVNSAYSLSYESLLNIINGLADGVSGQTLYLHKDQVNQLSDDDIAIASNKGWTISPAKTMTETVVVTDLSQVPSSAYNINPRTYDFSQFTGKWGPNNTTNYYTSLPCRTTVYSFEGDISNTTDASYMFSYMNNLYNVILRNTNKVTNMDYMFRACDKLYRVEIADTSNVTSMSNMFYGCKFVSHPTLNTSNVKNMNYMFASCKELVSVTELDTSNVENMGQMFSQCTSLTTVRLNTQNVIEMGQMFYSCSSLESVTMVGGVENLLYTTVMFMNVKPNGTFYYDDRYDYSKIIAELPSTWTAVPITV